MATWDELRDFVTGLYEISDDEGDRFSLVFGLPDDRAQMVILSRQSLLDGVEEWVEIASPIGDVADIDLLEALQLSSNNVVGALTVLGDVLVVKHSVPLATVDVDEFHRPLGLLVHTADAMEQEFFGDDDQF